jgi:hypothetical protein
VNKAFGKVVDYGTGAAGGFFSGIFANAYFHSFLNELFGYHEGWYKQYAPLLTVSALVFCIYVAALSASKGRARFIIAAILIVPTVSIYLWSRYLFSLDAAHGWIEFLALWTIVAQLAAMSLVGAWQLFWQSYNSAPTTS